MRRIRIQNPILDKTFKTYVATDYSSGTALEVLNTNSFQAQDIIVIGEQAEELTEAIDVSAIADKDTLTLSGSLDFSHGKGTPVYKSIWDKVSIESRSSSAGTFAQIVLTDIQWDGKTRETIYYHSSGTDSYEYRFRFYNSITATYSEYSPTLTGVGFSRQSVGYMIREVRKLTNTTDQNIVTDTEIMRQFNRAQDIIYSHNPRYWFLLVDTYKAQTGIPATAGDSVYSLATYSTYGHLDTIRYHYSTGGTEILYHLTKKSTTEFDYLNSNLNQGDEDHADMYKLLPADSDSDKGYFQVSPTTKTDGVGTFYPNYYEKMADLDDVGDETQVPLPGILEDYAIAFVYRIKGDETKAKLYESGLISDSATTVPKHLLLLDKMDSTQKTVQGQPRSLSQFKGQRAVRRFYGNTRIHSRDYIKENYMDEGDF